MKGIINAHAKKIEKIETAAAAPRLRKTGCSANARVPKAATVVAAEIETAAIVETAVFGRSNMKKTP